LQKKPSKTKKFSANAIAILMREEEFSAPAPGMNLIC
jgi:hypothetical protein